MEWATSKEINLTDGSMPKEAVSLERLITILYRYYNLFKIKITLIIVYHIDCSPEEYLRAFL